MHDTANTIGGLLLRTYARPGFTIIELGAMNINGALRDACGETVTYVGLDIAAGAGVDIVIQPDAPLPIASEVADIVIASSVFEHDMYFWGRLFSRWFASRNRKVCFTSMRPRMVLITAIRPITGDFILIAARFLRAGPSATDTR